MNITIADVRRHAQELVAIMGFTTLHTVDTRPLRQLAPPQLAPPQLAPPQLAPPHVVPVAAVVVLDA